MEAVSNIQELIRAIGANSSKKIVPVEIKTWDGRVVRGSTYEGPKNPEVISARTPCIDGNLLWSHVKTLLEEGKSFIVRNGQIDDARPFEWTISEN